MNLAKWGQYAGKVISKEKAIEFGKKGAGKIFEKKADETIQLALDKFDKTLKSKNDFSAKYEKLRHTLIDPDVDFEAFIDAINESSYMVKNYKNKLVDLHKSNPKNKFKLKKFTADFIKWETLLNNLREEASQRVKHEAFIVFELKKESKFFNTSPEINSQLISIETAEDFIKYISKINRLYFNNFIKER